MVMEDVWSSRGNLYQRATPGEFAQPKKVVEEPRRATRRLIETIVLAVMAFMVAMLPLIMTYIPAPESLLRVKDFMADWCTPSICFVFLVVGVMVATSGVLNNSHAGLQDRGEVYQRHVTVVHRDSLHMPDIFQMPSNILPLSIPVPPPAPFSVPISVAAVRDFPSGAPRSLSGHLRREHASLTEQELFGNLGKSPSTPLPRFVELAPVKLATSQSLTRESTRLSAPREPSRSNSFRDYLPRVVLSPSNVPTPRFDDDFEDDDTSHPAPIVTASNSLDDREVIDPTSPVSSIGQGSPRESLQDSPCESPRESPPESPRESPPESPRESPPESPRGSPPESPREILREISFESSQKVPTSSVAKRSFEDEIPVPPAPPPAPVFVRSTASASSVSSNQHLTRSSVRPTPASRPIETSIPAPPPPPVSPVSIRYSPPSPPPAPRSLPATPFIERRKSSSPGFESPSATPPASPPPPPPLPPALSLGVADTSVISPEEVNLLPIVVRKPSSRSLSNKVGGISVRESSGRRPPSRPQIPSESVAPVGPNPSVRNKDSESSRVVEKSGRETQKLHVVTDPPPEAREASAERSGTVTSGRISTSDLDDTNVKPGEDDVDQRVEAFLANFRQQMRLQRQESLLRQQRGED